MTGASVSVRVTLLPKFGVEFELVSTSLLTAALPTVSVMMFEVELLKFASPA